jgi:hypothetical protein
MDLDSILDQALDDFEEQQLQEKTAAASSSHGEKGSAPRDGEISANDLEAERIQSRAQMENLLRSLEDPTYGVTLQNVFYSSFLRLFFQSFFEN